MDINQILTKLNTGLSEITTDKGFEIVKPENPSAKYEFACEEDKCLYIIYKSAVGFFKISFENNTASFSVAKPDEDFVNISTSYFDFASVTDSDIKYLVNEYSDSIEDNFRFSKSIKNISDIKLPPTVSKTSAKNGSSYYDPATLASRYTVIFPELRDEYKRNIDAYGQFLPDEFFREYGKAAIDVIKENNKQQMKKLFNLLNDIYLDGTNETQSIIVVTILGQLNNDTQLLANCVDYMDAELASAVINVNKYLATRSGKNAKFLLENPPRYKPPKQKKSFLPKA